MKIRFVVTLAAGLLAGLLYSSRVPEVQAQTFIPTRYEYVGVRFMGGDRVMLALPDGTAKWLNDVSPYQRPKWADERVFNLAQAVNYLGKQGYEPALIPTLETHSDDIWMRRPVAK